ncbi:MAG TPA: NAD(P)-dependent oxidoreductase, partial [Planctomycetota bacterium]|nr:NAD(P)-dependent oxidoreductase [Planctomycetota bacterium]
HIPKPLAKAGAWIQDLFGDPFIKPWMIEFADDHYALDVTRARHQLGWTPRRSLRETLPRMISALKADPARWYHDHHLALPRRFRKALEAAG